MKILYDFKRHLGKFAPLIKYALFGIGTAAINFGVFFLGTEFTKSPNAIVFGLQWWQIVNLTAWILANLYSFYVTRKFVFKSGGKKPLFKEIAAFFGVRFFSFIISTQIMNFGINHLLLNHYIAKFSGTVFEVLINYFVCKIFVFK